jgi:protein kinase A
MKRHSLREIMSDKNKLKINISDYEKLETVGLGSFGRVRLCRNIKTNKIYVLKILKKSEIIRLKQTDHIYSEYHILAFLNHPFIIQLMGVNFDDPKYLYFLLEYIPGGELFTLLRKKKMFPLEQAKFYIAHIITIFEYIHSKNIIYRDLKPENILITKSGYLKLTDFGFAKYLDNDKTYTLCGTPEYLAPEIILNKGHGKPVDWWTMGILLYEMLIGIDPFSDDDPMAIYQKIVKGKIHFPKDIDKNAKSLIKHLLNGDTTKRFGCLKNGVKDIATHRFFDKFNWRNFVYRKMAPPFIPKVGSSNDTSNFLKYPDSDKECSPSDKSEDPFLDW